MSGGVGRSGVWQKGQRKDAHYSGSVNSNSAHRMQGMGTSERRIETHG